MTKKIIYDFGSNNGDDIPYYLLRSDLVVAVEANPGLCDQIKNRFPNELANGRLAVENCILHVGDSGNEVPFYIHKTQHYLSQLSKRHDINAYEEVLLYTKNVIKLINEHGNPHYIKIDIEHYDAVILNELFNNKITPTYISAESHSIEIFTAMVYLGKYSSFKLVDGATVSKKYKEHEIILKEGNIRYSFPDHSAGPFGNDISGSWMTAANFFKY
jgi:FkbM family methyltransferase